MLNTSCLTLVMVTKRVDYEVIAMVAKDMSGVYLMFS